MTAVMAIPIRADQSLNVPLPRSLPISRNALQSNHDLRPQVQENLTGNGEASGEDHPKAHQTEEAEEVDPSQHRIESRTGWQKGNVRATRTLIRPSSFGRGVEDCCPIRLLTITLK